MKVFAIFDEHAEAFQFYLESYKYYLDQFQPTAFEALKAAREANDARKLVSLANSIWFALPDESHIRRYPFSKLCDIAEYGYEDEPEVE